MKKNKFYHSMQAAKRLGQTAFVAAKAGVQYAVEKPDQAFLLRQSFESLGATYIKLGQFIASSPSVFPREYVEEFQSLLDQVKPLDFAAIEKVLIEEFAPRPLDDIFKSIDPQPLAAASIAQVHAATLATGEDVVIKVQKPGVETILHTDLGVVHLVAKLFERALPKIKFASLSDIIDEIRSRMIREVDFIEEAENSYDFLDYLDRTNNQVATAPKVFPQASTRRVLTMSRLYGVNLTDLKVVKKFSNDPSAVLMNALNTWFGSLTNCKSFHADLHAGNLMLLENGKVAFIDFGIVGHLKPEVWTSAIAFVESLQATDFEKMAGAMMGMGATEKHIDQLQLADDLKRLFQTGMFHNPTPSAGGPQINELNDVLLDMVEVGKRHGIHFPRDFALLMKQMLYFDRFMRALAPHQDVYADERLNLITEVQPESKLIH